LTGGTNIISYCKPSWSPDGSKIAFSHNTGIWIVNAYDGNQTMLVKAAYPYTFWEIWCGDPSLSPDSSKITFMSGEKEKCNICVISAEGSNKVNITGN